MESFNAETGTPGRVRREYNQKLFDSSQKAGHLWLTILMPARSDIGNIMYVVVAIVRRRHDPGTNAELITSLASMSSLSASSSSLGYGPVSDHQARYRCRFMIATSAWRIEGRVPFII